MVELATSKFGGVDVAFNNAGTLGKLGLSVPDMGRTFANTPEAISFVKSLHALKRIAEPGEIANSGLYLASELSSFTTGTALLADGGVSINRT